MKRDREDRENKRKQKEEMAAALRMEHTTKKVEERPAAPWSAYVVHRECLSADQVEG